MYIYLMRHGETDWNIDRRMQGRADVPLNDTGLDQARRAAAGMAGVPVDRILTSPLRRARQTAEAVAAGRDVAMTVEPMLMEMGFGNLEGIAVRDLPPERCVFSDPEHYTPAGGGESYAELDERCRRVLEEILPALERAGHHDVVLCSHGALIKGIVRRVLHRPLSQFWCDPPQANCSCTVLVSSGGQISLVEQGRIYR